MTDPAVPRPRSAEAASSHLRPAEPFPPATDVTLEGVHRSVVALTVQQSKLIERVDAHIETDERRSGLIHEELALLRADLGLRVTAVEQTQSSEQRSKLQQAAAKAGTGAVGALKVSVCVAAAVGVLNALASKWPWLADVARALGAISL